MHAPVGSRLDPQSHPNNPTMELFGDVLRKLSGQMKGKREECRDKIELSNA